MVKEATGAGLEFVPTQLSREIIKLVREKTWCRQLFSVVQMGSNKVEIPKVTGGATAYWTDEVGSITSSDLTTAKVSLEAKKLAALVPVSTEIIEDANIGILDLVINDIAAAIADKEEDAFINGDTAADGPFDGLIKLAGATVDGGNNALSEDEIRKAMANLGKYGRNKADLVILASPNNISDMLAWDELRTVDKYGPHATVITGEVGKVYGARVIESAYMPDDKVLVLNKNAPVIGDRRKITMQKQYDIDTDSWKVQATERVAFAVRWTEAICKIINVSP